MLPLPYGLRRVTSIGQKCRPFLPRRVELVETQPFAKKAFFSYTNGMKPTVYILRCSDATYYVGMTTNLESRIRQHESGVRGSYVFSRRPFELVWHMEFKTIREAGFFEKKVKKWSQAKKEALMKGDWDEIKRLSLNRPLRQAQGDEKNKQIQGDEKDKKA